MCQDSDGFMWFGSVDGLNVYDGREVRILRNSDGETLSGNLIENMIETEPNVFWIQTNYGLDRFDKRSMDVRRYDAYTSNYRLRSGGDVQLFFMRDGGSGCEIVYCNEESSRFGSLPLEGFAYGDLLDYFVTNDNTLWLLCRDGRIAAFSFVRDENGTRTLAPFETTFEHPHGLLYAFHEGTAVYFVDTTGTLYEYDTEEKKKYYVSRIGDEIERRGDISSIVKSRDDYFVAFQTDGLICLRNTPDRAQAYNTEHIDIRVGVFCLLKDRRQDIIWIGTDGQGVYIYSDDGDSVKSTLFDNFTTRIDNPVRAILLDGDNSLWVATKGDGLFRLRDYDFNRSAASHRIDYFDTLNSHLSDNSVYSLSSGENGVMWIGSDGGIDWFDYDSGTIRRLDVTVDGEPLRYVHGVVQLVPDTLWIATVGTGMVRVDLRWNGRTPQVVSSERFTIGDGSMSANYFFTVFGESPDTVWFGNRGHGAYRHDIPSGEFHSVQFDDPDAGHAVNDIFCIARGDAGRMWFGTGAGLVGRMPDGKFTVYGESSGSPISSIRGILTGSGGNLWLSTNFGIIRFNPSTETFVTSGRNTPSDILEFSDGAFFRSADQNILFFGGINGFIAIRENEYAAPGGYIPPIAADRLTIFGQEYNIYDYLSDNADGTPLLELNYRENFFSLSLTAIDYIDAHNYTYMYRLEGINEAWIDNGPNNTIYFTSLDPGNYTLRLRCLNRETGTESDEYVLDIHIRPPWYMSTAAYMVYGLMALGLLWLVAGFLVKRGELRRKTMIDDLRQEHMKEVYESKLRFFTNIAHEFCTPLTLIHGPCDRIISHKGSDRFVLRYAELIRRNADRMNDLIRDLIEFRRIETGNKTPRIESADISGLVASVFDNFTELAESRGYTYSSDIPHGIEWNTDRDFLTIILGNFISNAFKYTNPNGKITVGLSVCAGELRIAVTNTGKGIRAENIEHLFDRYTILDDFEHRNDNSPTRNGLGLAISYNMVQLLGGRIEVDSELAVETSFIMYLPPAEPTPDLPGLSIGSNIPSPVIVPLNDRQASTNIPEYVFDERKPTIMVIDDETDMLWFIGEIFSREYNVIPVNRPSNIDELLEYVLPGMIICDVMMPGVDGISITRRLKTNPKTAHVPLILVSAKHHVDEQIEGLEAGADLYITKPFNTDYLRTAVRHLIVRKETLKEYFASPISAYELTGGKMTHVDDKRFVEQILDIITANLTDEKLSAQFIADRMNMSMRRLYRKLEDAGAERPLQMIHHCRLHAAREMLQNTTMTIDEIIYKSGFRNRASFFNTFSRKFGCTPREYRERHGNGME
jgi:signal transduction histidine kinase/DNA-binding response OmpR family regulator/ligand-binding sensor domain-containing protein